MKQHLMTVTYRVKVSDEERKRIIYSSFGRNKHVELEVLKSLGFDCGFNCGNVVVENIRWNNGDCIVELGFNDGVTLDQLTRGTMSYNV